MKGTCRIWLRRAPSVTDRVDLDLLDEPERSTNRQFATESLRARHASAHALLRRALGQTLGVDPSGLCFELGKNDRPRLANQQGMLDFNLSHSGPYVACAVVDARRVGIDVEIDNPRMDYCEVLDRVASPAERSWIQNKSPDEARRAFYRVWVLKEAFAKARGDGLNLPFAEITLMPRSSGLVQELKATGERPEHWSIARFDVNEDAALAVAVKSEDPRRRGIRFEVVEGRELLC